MHYHAGQMLPTLNPESPPEEFIKTLKILMPVEHVSLNNLRDVLQLSVGTIRNWFYGNKAIPKKHRIRIAEYMKDPYSIRREWVEVIYLSVCIGKDATRALWCSAAGVPEYDFKKAYASDRLAKRCAQWCTEVIMGEAQRILKKLPKDRVDNLACQLFKQERKKERGTKVGLKPRRESGLKLSRGSYIIRVCDDEAAGLEKLYIPLLIDEYSHYLVKVAAEVARRKNRAQAPSFGEFVASCLDAAATVAFDEELNRVCSQGK